MMMQDEPLVSVITPVYNGEQFLAECIESVLSQTYRHFEYIIVNNCSKDRTLEIARSYEKKDSRIKVFDNEKFVGVIENHNGAFRRIAADSKYCKVVSGDDAILPECLARLVAFAEANPSAGLVGAYQVSGGGSNWRNWEVRWTEIPYPTPLSPGREIARATLLGGPYVFGTPTSLLYRADLVRKDEGFYPNPTTEADTSACYKVLQNSDFGFVHEVLSYERVHEIRISTTAIKYGAYICSKINDLQVYGLSFMNKNELDARIEEIMKDYYHFLAVGVVNFQDKKFWDYHKRRLKEFGFKLDYPRLAWATFLKIIDLVLNPKRTIELFSNRSKASAS